MYITCTIKRSYKAVVVYFVVPVSTTVLGVFLLFFEAKTLFMSSRVMDQFLLTSVSSGSSSFIAAEHLVVVLTLFLNYK